MSQKPNGQNSDTGPAHHQVRGANAATKSTPAMYSQLIHVTSPNPSPSMTAGSVRSEVSAASITSSYDLEKQ